MPFPLPRWHGLCILHSLYQHSPTPVYRARTCRGQDSRFANCEWHNFCNMQAWGQALTGAIGRRVAGLAPMVAIQEAQSASATAQQCGTMRSGERHLAATVASQNANQRNHKRGYHVTGQGNALPSVRLVPSCNGGM
jgi:hypothetical protein